MRCPKCGYISFDHLEVCLKCNKNIGMSSSSLNGFVLNVKAPSFLNLQVQQSDELSMESGADDAVLLDEDFVDEDLDILVEDDDIQINLEDDEMDSFALPEDSISLDSDGMSEEEDSREIEIDLSQFEVSSKPEEAETVHSPSHEASININFPEELADISDLAPPAKGAENANATDLASRETEDEEFPDLELGDLDFDLGLDDLDSVLPSGSAGKEKTALTLDDIEFPDTLAPGGAKKKQSESGKEIDDDLNIELDLGGLTIHKDV